MVKLQPMEDNETANSQSKQQKSEESIENSTGLLDYMRTQLDAVDHKRVNACNISIVPEQLRKSNAEAYMPQVVSIGPVHRGTRTNLLYMEEIKWRCMKHLFKRTKLKEETCLKKCSRAMLKLDGIVRASYVDDVKYNRDDLAKISMLDGCFLLELLITHYLEQTTKEKELEAAGVEDIDKDSKKIDIESQQVVDRRKPKLRCCVSRLEAAGVTIIGVETKNERPYRFDLKINFSDGQLKIPQLHITRTTEAKWRNLIAWEVNRTNLVKHRGGKQDETRFQFISYAWFIQSLICCVHDVKLLRDRKVILVDEMETDKSKKNIMSDEDLLNLFRKMTEGISKAQIEMDDPRFVQEIHKLNSYTRTVDRATETGRVMWHSFRCFLTWIRNKCIGSFKVLKVIISLQAGD